MPFRADTQTHTHTNVWTKAIQETMAMRAWFNKLKCSDYAVMTLCLTTFVKYSEKLNVPICKEFQIF